MARQRLGNRYLASLSMAFTVAFFAVGTLGPARHSPYYVAIVPIPSAIALFLGWRAWTSDQRSSTAYSAATLLFLLAVLVLSHLLPRSAA